MKKQVLKTSELRKLFEQHLPLDPKQITKKLRVNKKGEYVDPNIAIQWACWQLCAGTLGMYAWE